MSHAVEKQKHQVYLADGEEVILEDIRKTSQGTDYYVRRVGWNQKNEYEFSPTFIVERLQSIGRVIAA